MRIAHEVQVGVTVVVSLILMVVGYFFLRGVGLSADMYYLRLKGPATISAGNDVRLQGIKVGEVKDVVLDPDTQKPLLTLAIRRKNKLLRTYNYAVSSGALIGESYVDIKGTYDPSAALFVPNDETQIIEGNASAGFAGLTDEASDMMKDFSTTLGKFNVTLDRVNKGVLSYENQVKLTRTLENVTKMTERIGQSFGPQGIRFGFGDPAAQASLNRTLAGTAETTTNMGALLRENRTQLHDLFEGLNKASTNIAGLTESLQFIVSKGGLRENAQIAFNSLRRTAENFEVASNNIKTLTSDPNALKDVRATFTALREATESLRDTTKTIGTAVNDPNTQGQIKSIITTLNSTVATLQTSSNNLRDITAGLKNVAADPKVQSDLKAIPAEMRGTLEATRATAERLNSLLGGRRNRNSSRTGAGGGAAAQQQGYAPGGVDFTYRHFGNVGGGPRVGSDVSGHNFGDLTFNSELFGGPFRLGISGIGDANDITAQTGTFLGRDGAARYGIYRSKLGVGADYHSGRFSLEGNWWDPNNRSFNGYLGYQITPQAEILLGRESIRGVRSDVLGVRLTP